MTSITPHINIEIPATVDHVDRILVSVKLKLETDLPGYLEFPLELVLRETLMNAVKHGSNYDPEKKVGLTIEWDDKWFTIQVSDEGEGYRHTDSHHKPSAPTAESGRGLPIIDYYSERVTRNSEGNEITIKMSIYGEGHSK